MWTMHSSARWIAALAIAALLLAASACGADGTGAGSPSVSEIVSAPEQHHGESATVEVRVSNPIDHRVWEVADGRIFVIYDRGLDRGLGDGERLRVSGTVRPLERDVIEGELGIDIEDHFFDEPFLEDDVALVAEEVTRLDGA